nr:hypothetical protein [uncultured bacterium]
MVDESVQKLRGGYYTPLDLATFLAKWVNGVNPEKVLEPSCGDGVFFSAFAHIGGLAQGRITGFELDPREAIKARTKATQCKVRAKIHQEDFLGWAKNKLGDGAVSFDAVVGNPPFIRYQYLPPEFQSQAEAIFRTLGLPFTKHTNAWVPFVLASIALLRPGGRLAMVVPAEIIHIPHAQALRTYLGKSCRRIVIVDPEEMWFDETLQGTVLLLAEKLHDSSDHPHGLGIYPVKGREFLLLDPETVFMSPKAINGKTIEGKWTRALLDSSTLALIDKLTRHPNVHVFKDIADVDVGIVTGANDYFLVSEKTVKQFHLSPWAHPMFGRSQQCPGIIFDKTQHQANIKGDKPAYFIWFSKDERLQDSNALAYIQHGEKQNFHIRYKCRVRAPWYSVTSVYATEIGMLKRAHNLPRLVLNKMGAFTTDTAYRINSQIPAKQLVGSFINSLTALSAELEGRHYGGGVLELVPSEIEHLLLPIPDDTVFDLGELDDLVRTADTELILRKQDTRILTPLGISEAERLKLLTGWKKLRNRRQRISQLED